MINSSEYSPFYQNYIDLASSYDLLDGLDSTLDNTLKLYESIPTSKASYAYDSGKWTVKQLIAHVIDTERIFQYRALRIAREKGSCSGFNEDLFADNNTAVHRSISDLADEFHAVRLSTIALFDSFTLQELMQLGFADQKPLSARACGFIIVGHALHHNQILEKRYLNH